MTCSKCGRHDVVSFESDPHILCFYCHCKKRDKFLKYLQDEYDYWLKVFLRVPDSARIQEKVSDLGHVLANYKLFLAKDPRSLPNVEDYKEYYDVAEEEQKLLNTKEEAVKLLIRKLLER